MYDDVCYGDDGCRGECVHLLLCVSEEFEVLCHESIRLWTHPVGMVNFKITVVCGLAPLDASKPNKVAQVNPVGKCILNGIDGIMATTRLGVVYHLGMCHVSWIWLFLKLLDCFEHNCDVIDSRLMWGWKAMICVQANSCTNIVPNGSVPDFMALDCFVSYERDGEAGGNIIPCLKCMTGHARVLVEFYAGCSL